MALHHRTCCILQLLPQNHLQVTATVIYGSQRNAHTTKTNGWNFTVARAAVAAYGKHKANKEQEHITGDDNDARTARARWRWTNM